MVHRTNMRSVDITAPPERVIDEILATPYSRVPVWENEPENIVGIVHAKDLLKQLRRVGGEAAKIDIRAIATKPWFVPTRPASTTSSMPSSSARRTWPSSSTSMARCRAW